MKLLKKIREILKKKMKTPYFGQPSESDLQLMYLYLELNNKLMSLDKQVSQMIQSSHPSEQTSIVMEESSGNLEIQLDEESYQELCKALDLDKIEFMGIS